MGSNNNALWNGVSILFLIATVVAILITIVVGFTGGQVEPQSVPTPFVLPTVTETPIPPTATPTDIPTITQTPTPTTTGTLLPTGTFTPTNTATPQPSATITTSPTVTSTPDVTETSTVIPSPTGPSPTPLPPYPFAGPADATFTQNFTNSQGCAWQGIGGQVFSLDGASYTNALQVHVYGQGVDLGRVFTGTNNLYGASGYEVRVENSPTNGTYVVQLETRNGVPVSEPVQITFPGDCQQNVAIVDFRQVRSLNP